MKGVGTVTHDGHRIVLLEHPNPPLRVWEMPLQPSGQPFTLVSSLTNRLAEDTLTGSSVGNELYFIGYDRPLHQHFYRYQQGQLQELPPLWETDLTRFVRWVTPVVIQAAIAFLVGVLTLVIGANWLSRSQESRYESGATAYRLASIWRRCAARGIDLAIILAWVGIVLIRLSPQQIAVDAYEVFNSRVYMPYTSTPLLETATGQALVQSVLWTFVVVVILIVTQARWGWTPGKGLCGQRVMRTTLRRCGFARSLLRELLFAADAPALVTALPGIATMLITDHRQRLGDLMADTVVVDVRS